ncbi:hypothetical protein GAH_00358 [Geoglobus ahangari]|uniref:Uncharacterized protein n=1 Tax=Geoglobus ahangari TaxID=113653 RepID=A0A0F7IF73_9EURY|nr:hypothetical protein [Geoglobus ahangari]AKG92289.1 hypothetical protein GAH_00358 [Geoglobus ahangari]
MKIPKPDEAAVSPVLGLVLAFAIIVGGIGVVQQFFVPAWLKNAEGDHYSKLHYEFGGFHEKVLEAINYGEAVARFDPVMRYPKYPLLFTPEVTSSSILAKRIGKVNLTVDGETRSFDLTVLEFDPNYIYLKPSKEAYICGEYFALSNSGGTRISDEYISGDDEVRLIILDLRNENINSPQTITMRGAKMERSGSITLEVKVISPDYRWYLEYLNETFGEKDFATVTFSKGENRVLVQMDNVTFVLGMAGEGERNEYLKNVSSALNKEVGVLKISKGDGTYDEIENGDSTKEIDISSTLKVDDGIVTSLVYFTGYTKYPNADAEVTIEYVFEDDTVTVNTTWRTNPDGYLQLPVSVSGAVDEGWGHHGGKGHRDIELPERIDVTITVVDEVYSASLRVSD